MMLEWMKELYIAVLVFGVLTAQLTPYKRPVCRLWSFMSMGKGMMSFKKYYDTQYFIDVLQKVDDVNNPDEDQVSEKEKI